MRNLLAFLVVVLVLAVGSLPAFAQGGGEKPDDVAATRAYLLAWHKSTLGGKRDQRAGEAAVQGLVANVKSECSGVLSAVILTVDDDGRDATVRVYDGAHGVNDMHRHDRHGEKAPAAAFHAGTLGEGMRAAIAAVRTDGRERIITATTLAASA